MHHKAETSLAKSEAIGKYGFQARAKGSGTDYTALNNLYIVTIALQSVQGANYIGSAQDDMQIWGTARSAAPVVVSLCTNPEDAVLPAGFVTWSGGQSATPDGRVGNFDRSTLASAVDFYAEPAPDLRVFNSNIYVFPAKEWQDNGPFVGEFSRERDPNRSTEGNTGMAWIGTVPRDVEFYIYFDQGKWRFHLAGFCLDSYWNVDSCGRRDIPSDYPWPDFPESSMPPILVGYIARRTEAKMDFYPDSYGRTRRHWYWCEWITSAHEDYHISDWYSRVDASIDTARNKMRNDRFVVVTLDKLDPETVLNDNEPTLKQVLQERIDCTFNDHHEGDGHETRAYRHCRPHYMNLSSSIRIQ